MNVVILQRVVPHYRMALFDRLHQELGWTVVTGRREGGHGLNVAENDPPWLHRFDFKRQPSHQYRAKVPVDAILEALAPDAVIAEFTPQMSSTWRLSRDAMLGRTKRRKLVYWSQGPNVERGFRKLGDLATQALRLALLAPADAQLCYTQAGADYLRRWLPGKPSVFVASNTVDLDAFPGRGIDASSADARAANLLFVGRLTPDKRVPMLVEAVAQARRTVPGLTLTIIGDGPDMAAARSAAKGLDDAVTFTGAIYSDDALAPHFQRASLFVYAGSIGLAANHALAYGLPIMIFDDPGEGARHHPENAYVVDDVTGYRVLSATTSALADRIVVALSGCQTPRATLGHSIRRFADEHLSIDRMVEGFQELGRFLDTRSNPR